MDDKAVKIGMNVRATQLEDTTGMNIRPRYLDMRGEGKMGHVLGPVPDHKDVWWVGCISGEIAPYRPSELEKIEEVAVSS